MYGIVTKMLIRHEGYKLKPYRCSANKWSIGIGHNFQDNPLPAHIQKYLDEHGEITDDMVMELFEADVAQAIRDCRLLYLRFDTFTPNRRAALVDLLFNMGYSRMSKFVNTNKAINEGKWAAASRGIRNSLYYRQLGGDPPGTDDGRYERPEEIADMILKG